MAEEKSKKTENVKETEKLDKAENKENKTVEKTAEVKKTTTEAKKTVEKTEKKSNKTETKKVENKDKKQDTKKKDKEKKVAKQDEVSEAKEAKAILKYERMSSRKIKIVADLIRGKDCNEAMAILKFAPKAGAEILEKLLKSAMANAENNHSMDMTKAYISEIYANQGPTLKRIRPAAKGSAVRIRKRTSHITIILREHE